MTFADKFTGPLFTDTTTSVDRHALTADDLDLIADALLIAETEYAERSQDDTDDPASRANYAEKADRCTALFVRVCAKLDTLRPA